MVFLATFANALFTASELLLERATPRNARIQLLRISDNQTLSRAVLVGFVRNLPVVDSIFRDNFRLTGQAPDEYSSMCNLRGSHKLR